MVFGRRKKNTQATATAEDAGNDQDPKDNRPEEDESNVPSAAAGQSTESSAEQSAEWRAGQGAGSSTEQSTESSTGQSAGDGAAAETGSGGETVPGGPYDAADRPETASAGGYIDLGALRIVAAEGMQLRLEVEERTQRVVAVTLDQDGSSLQLQAFAAPKSEGLWAEIREQIAASVGSQGGTVEEIAGRFGPEVLAKLPAQAPDGTTGFRVARFVGVDGPRWFLRGVFGGPAALNRNAAAGLEDIFRNVVVVRGESPMPPRDLLPLRLPTEATAAPAAPDVQDKPDLNRIKRGPEITKIG